MSNLQIICIACILPLICTIILVPSATSKESMMKLTTDNISSNAASGTAQTAWSSTVEADMLRDTLTFQFGKVSELLLARTFRNADSAAQYSAWLQSCAQPLEDADVTLELLSAEHSSGGELTIVARSQSDEFICYLRHPEFNGTLSLAFSAIERQTIGVHLITFNGKPMSASKWLQGLSRALKTQYQRDRAPALLN